MSSATVMMPGIRVEHELVDLYRTQAEELGVSLSELIRRAMRTFMELPIDEPFDTSLEVLVRQLVDERFAELRETLDAEAA